MAALDNIASELLKSANEADLIYKRTRDQAQRDKAVRLRRIVENLKAISAGGLTPTLDEVLTEGNVSTNTLNVGGITSDYFQLDTAATPTLAPGMFAWNDAFGTADLRLKGNNVTLQVGQETLARVVNKTGSDLLESQYKVVRVRIASEGGAQGQRLAVVLAQGDNDPDSATTLGVVTETILNNQEGFITILGNVNNINTTGSLQGETWVDGDVLYLSPTTPGSLTKVKPTAPQHTLIVGYVVYAHNNQGKIFVKVDNGYELDELHNVLITSPANNDLLQYNSTQQVWKNIPVGTAVPTPTLAQVTTAGNTTTNSITVGGLTVGQVGGNGVINFPTSTSGFATSIYSQYAGNSLTFQVGSRTLQLNGGGQLNTNFNTTITGSTGSAALVVQQGNAAWSPVADFNGSAGTALRVNTNGNILIGTTTDSGYRLDVNGTARVQGDFTAGLQGASNTVFRFYAGTSYGGQANITFAGQGYNGVSIGIGSGANPFLGNNLLITRSYLNEYGNHAYGFIGLDNTLPMSFRFGTAGSTIESLRLTNTQVTAYQKLVTLASITASSALAAGVFFNNTLVAAANNDVLVGLDINPTFTNGAFTGVQNIGLRIFGSTAGNAPTLEIRQTSNTAPTWLSVRNTSNLGSVGAVAADLGISGGSNQFFTGTTQGDVAFKAYSQASSSKFFIGATAASTANLILFTTGNVGVNISTDAGYKLDVNGTLIIRGNTTSQGNFLLTTSGTGLSAGNATTAITSYGANGAAVGYTFSLNNQYSGGNINRNFFAVGDNFYLISNFSTGTNTVNWFGVYPVINNTGGTTIIRGIYYNPTLTSLTGTTHRAIETTSGDVIFNGGNVGIGTSSPTDKFHIVDNTNGNKFARISAGGTDASAAWVAQNDQVDNIVYRVFGSAVTGSQMGQALARSASLIANLGGTGKFLIGSYSGTDLIFGTSDQARMRLVDATGNFLIGTMTDTGNKLTVSGNIDAQGYKVNNVLGYTGILNIPTNPPGQQNIDIQGGIVINIF